MLLTLGDSFTVKRYEQDYPWPEQLANLMNLELLNVSMEGGGNDYMFRNFYEIVNTKNISHVVLALSNWDRLEIGITNSLNYIGNISKPKILKPKIVNDYEEKYLLKELFYDFYDIRYYYDKTLSQILSFQQLCKLLDIKFKIIQLIQPFHKTSIDYKSDSVELLKQHVNKCNMIDKIDGSNVVGYNYTFENISHTDIDDKNLLCLFQHKNKQIQKFVLGYHDLDLFYNNNYKNYKLFDFHPTHYGHKVIAKEVYESFNT